MPLVFSMSHEKVVKLMCSGVSRDQWHEIVKYSFMIQLIVFKISLNLNCHRNDNDTITDKLTNHFLL